MGEIDAEEQDEGTPQGGVISPLLANIYLNPLDHLMSKLGHEMVRYADDMVILCPSAQAAETVLQTLREWSAQAGLTLHPEKTKIDSLSLTPAGQFVPHCLSRCCSAVDMGQPKARFEFLGYKFWRSKTGGRRLLKFMRSKSMKKLREGMKPYLKRANGRSLKEIVTILRPKLQGFFNYFKHVSAGAFDELDGWIRGRLRSILRKRAGRKGRGRGLDHHRWPNHYFTKLGLFDLRDAHKFEIIRLRAAANY